MNTLSTHILDVSTGKPAEGVLVQLSQGEKLIAKGITNDNGRIVDFVSEPLTAGRYLLVAEIGTWFAASGRETLYPIAQIDFVISETADDHFHLPFLIAPGGWSTYRGS